MAMLRRVFSQQRSFQSVIWSQSPLFRAVSSNEKSHDSYLKRPKRPANAYLLYRSDFFRTFDRTGTSRLSEINVELRKAWFQLPDSEKKKYLDKAKEMSDEFKKASEIYEFQKIFNKDKNVSEMGQKERDAFELWKSKPKKPLTTFFLFLNHLRQQRDSKLTIREAKNIWDTLSDAEKRKFSNESKKNIETYHSEMDKWEQIALKKGFSQLVKLKTLKSHKEKDCIEINL